MERRKGAEGCHAKGVKVVTYTVPHLFVCNVVGATDNNFTSSTLLERQVVWLLSVAPLRHILTAHGTGYKFVQ